MKNENNEKRIEQIIKELKEKGIELVQIKDNVWQGEKFGSLYFTIFLDPKGIISYDSYAELKGGIYETGDLIALLKYMLRFKEILEKEGAREINTTERLYPADRRGKHTRTSGI